MFVGLFWFLLSLYAYGGWITGPDFKPNTTGRELAPEGYVLWVRLVELASVLLALTQIWHFILKPKLRTGSMSFDGLFFLACWSLYLQEPWLNYNNHQFLYTTVSYNMGSWVNYIPGWNSPNGELIPVGSVIWFTAYLNLVGLWAYAGGRFMAWVKARKPDISNARLIAVTFIAFLPFDLLLEHIILRSELFNYASTVPELTLWAGLIYQFPIYEALSWCGCLTAWSCVYYFRNDRGESFIERGIDKMRFPGTGIKTFARLLIMMGFCHSMFLLLYNIPYFYWSTKGGSFPPYGEYRTGGLCGPDTNFDCPSESTPVPKRKSYTNRVIPESELPLQPR
jgi:Spirocyclase AveC-like